MGLKNGLARLNLDTGAIQHLVDPEKDKPNNRFNDGKCDPQGRFWVGSIGNEGTENSAALYCFESNGHIEVKIPNVTISNGLVWSRDQKTFYYIDSITQSIHAYDYDPTSGSIANQKTIVTFNLQKEGVPDGMAIDEQDNLWVAMFGGSSVICVDSSTCKKIYSVTLSYKAGAPLRQVQLSLGHSSIRTTEIYLGLDQDLANAPGDYLNIEV